ncbi:MAG TPA: hypothetical protein VGF77_17215 [Allosphingosinicella sp.]|jgi:hypothetical protein
MIGKAPMGAILALTLAGPGWADMGPKPSMAFTFTLPGQIEIKSGVLYNCEDAACKNPKPLQPLGPQRFSCDPTRCSARAYGFGRYFQVELTLTDGRVVKCSPTKVTRFDGRYYGVVRGHDLVLTPRP